MNNYITFKKINQEIFISKTITCEECGKEAEVGLDKESNVVAHTGVNFSYVREQYLCEECFFKMTEVKIDRVTKKDVKEFLKKIGI